jgi:hypothetical protein
MTRGSRGAGPACSALAHDFRMTNVSRLYRYDSETAGQARESKALLLAAQVGRPLAQHVLLDLASGGLR